MSLKNYFLKTSATFFSFLYYTLSVYVCEWGWGTPVVVFHNKQVLSLNYEKYALGMEKEELTDSLFSWKLITGLRRF